jgi:hypothetical protein
MAFLSISPKKIWADPLHVLIPDRLVDGEQRWRDRSSWPGDPSLGGSRHPDPEDENRVRIIGARKATRHERKFYEEGA